MRYGPYLAAILIALPLCFGDTTHAGFVLDLTEIEGDVVASGTGAINTTSLRFVGRGGNFVSTITADKVSLFSGPHFPAGRDVDIYGDITGPSMIGTGTTPFNADSGGGDAIGIRSGISQFIYLPRDYISNSSLNSYATWSNQTFSSLGLTPGTYTWTWGAGANSDSFTLNIGVSSVPEPASVVMLGLGACGVAGATIRRRRAA